LHSLGRSQVGKARDFDSRMRWFESSRPSQFYYFLLKNLEELEKFFFYLYQDLMMQEKMEV
jgi:hypothetical protein